MLGLRLMAKRGWMLTFGSSWTESGDVALLAAVVADDLVDLNDDVLGNLGLYGIAVDYLDERNALFVILFR